MGQRRSDRVLADQGLRRADHGGSRVPAYGLARLVVGHRWALFAAAGTGLSPALAYAPILVKEPTAYPAATLALFLITRWLARPTLRGAVLAVAACVLGLIAKDQLAVLFPIFGAAGLALVWRGARMTEFRRAWTPGRLGRDGDTRSRCASSPGGAYVAHRSQSWYIATTFYQGRMLDFGLWAAGALAIGLGVVPVVAGLASVVRPRDEAARPGTFALAFVTIVSVVCFGVYTAVKAAYLSTVFANLTLERNLIFLVPLLFAGTALFFERRGGRWWAVVAAGIFVLYLVRTTPYSLTQYPNYEAHGLAIDRPGEPDLAVACRHDRACARHRHDRRRPPLWHSSLAIRSKRLAPYGRQPRSQP